MSNDLESTVQQVCEAQGKDRTRMLDIVREVQRRLGCVPGAAMDRIAAAVGAHRNEVESVVTFYAFLSEEPTGEVVIRVCDDIVDRHAGALRVLQVLGDELGIAPGQTTPDGKIALRTTPCIGMSDQAPSALVNDVVVTYLSPDKARRIARALKKDPNPAELVTKIGDGNNAHELVGSMVYNNVRRAGEVLLGDHHANEGLRKALAMTPAEVIRDVKTARLRGRGGAGFPTGMKWDFTRSSPGEHRCVLCNADEGEPGTFKDRVLLTERPDLLFEGMTIAAYAVGADLGVLYLRAEYAYLYNFLQHVLQARREAGLLGRGVSDKQGFDFDIRIQLGAGAYVCGEETSLISSCEGLRGDPKTRPPFPANRGYLGYPTTVNNVETLCCVPPILDRGPGWFSGIGSEGSPGTKLLSICGDCRRPGVYEVPFGMSLREVLDLCAADDPAAVQMGGPSGTLVAPGDFARAICYDDLATGGSVMVFGAQRNLLEVVHYFLEFFIEESCGYCTPCRVGNVLLQRRLEKIMAGRGEPGDLPFLQRLGATMRATARCGLGQTSPNPVLTAMEHFPDLFGPRLHEPADRFEPSFDLAAALREAETVAGRSSVHGH